MTLATSGISAGNDILSFTRSGNRTASASTSAGGFSGSYAYDLAGRMTTDGLRAHRYTYNLKGMTQSVCDSSGTALVTYTYHEDGTKKSESYPDGSGRLYYGPVEYTFSGGSIQNAHLDLAHFGDGVYRKNENGTWQTLWFVRDRTGSVVSVLDISYPYRNISDEGVLVSQMGYSPYGTEIAGEGFAQDSTLRYRYAGKERQDTRQVLPEISGVAAYRSTIPGIINFGARMYDPLTGSWLTPDPLAHKYTSWSPYAYCAGNPVSFVDPDGRFVGILVDATSVALGVKNLIENIRLGNTRAAIGDGVGVAIDVVAAAFPVIPGRVGFVRTGTKSVDIVDAINDATKSKTYVTYTKTNPITKEVYSGRASGYGTPEEIVAQRDKWHHMNSKGYDSAVLDKSSKNFNAIRGQEQYLIDKHGGAKSWGGTSGNMINGISPKNQNKGKYETARRKEFE